MPAPRNPLSPAAPVEWHAGDLAECIVGPGDGRWLCADHGYHAGPIPHEVRVVGAVSLARRDAHTAVVALCFARYGDVAFDCAFFRKVEPRADAAIAASASFIGQLTGAPAPTTENA